MHEDFNINLSWMRASEVSSIDLIGNCGLRGTLATPAEYHNKLAPLVTDVLL